MIGVRGPNNIEVLEPKGIPVKEIAESVLLRNYLTGIARRYGISREELFEAIDHYLSVNILSNDDMVEFKCDFGKTDELNVTTISVSDLVFISTVMFGTIHDPAEDSINDLYVKGIAELIRECLIDVSNHSEDYKANPLHNIVYRSFCKAYGEIDNVEADILLLKMEGFDGKH